MDLLDLVHSTRELLEPVPGGRERAADLEACYQEVASGTLRIYIAGPDKAGKSTLVNVLLRKVVARTGVRPTTITVQEYPWGKHLLCDTMGYLADRSATMPDRVANMVGRAAVVVFLMPPEGLGPVDRAVLLHIHETRVPLLLVVNRMDTIDGGAAVRADIEQSMRESLPFLGPGVPVAFVSLRDAFHEDGNFKAELPARVARLENAIREAVARAERAPGEVLLRRIAEHLKWLLRNVDEGVVTSSQATLKRLQEEVAAKRRWLRARLDRRLAAQMENFDKFEEALLAAVDACDTGRIESVAQALKDFGEKVVTNFAESLRPDVHGAVADLGRAVRDAAERFEREGPDFAPAGVTLDVEGLAQAGKEAAEALNALTETSKEALLALAQLSKVLRNRVLMGMAIPPLLEVPEEVVKNLLASSSGTVSAPVLDATIHGASTGASSATAAASAEQIGNALQIAGVALTVVVFVMGLVIQRKKIEAARKEIAARMAVDRNNLRIQLEANGNQMIERNMEPFEKVLDALVEDIRKERDAILKARKRAEDLLMVVGAHT